MTDNAMWNYVYYGDDIYSGGSSYCNGHTYPSSDLIFKTYVWGKVYHPMVSFKVNDDNKVGIGTTSPSEKLHISGRGAQTMQITSTDGDSTNLIFHRTGTPDDWKITNKIGELYFDYAANDLTGWETRLFIDSDGKAGIGTTSPSEKLHISGSGSQTMQITSTNGHSTNLIFHRTGTSDDWKITKKTGKLFFDYADDDLSGWETRLFIDSDGKAGIGTISPSNKLSVEGDADFTGNVGIGTSTPSQPLEVIGDVIIGGGSSAYDHASEFLGIEGQSDKWYLGVRNESSSSDADFFIGLSSNEDGIFHIRNNGHIGINTTSPGYLLTVNGDAAKPGGGFWTLWSDIRLKDIKGDYQKGLEEIIQLHPVVYSYKKDNPKNLPCNTEYTGFIAQEVQKVFPEAVTEGEDGYLALNMQAVNVAVINALKQLKEQYDLLKEQYDLFQTKNKQLEKRIESLEKDK